MNKYMCLVYSLAVCMTLLSLGCSEDEPCIPHKTTGPIVPLAVGNQWIYKVTIYPGHHEPMPDSIYFDTIKVYGKSVINGEECFDYYIFGCCVNRSDGLWHVDSGPFPPGVLFKYPGEVGDYAPFFTSDTMFVTAIDTVVRVPYGCFYTYSYQEVTSPFQRGGRRYFFAPSVGLVKSEYWTDSHLSKKSKQFELVSATLN